MINQNSHSLSKLIITIMKKNLTLSALFLILISFICTLNAQTIVYVNASAMGANNGNSWTDAYTRLSDALQFTNVNPTIQYEIRVASGTYYPTGAQNGTKRDSTFLIRQGGGIKLMGGYNAATNMHDIEANTTILSGNIGTLSDTFDNSYHVLVITGLAASADSVVVDGFTISDGIANGTFFHKNYNGQTIIHDEGGGININYNAIESKIIIRNCIISGNRSSYVGGVYIYSSSPAISDCHFIANSALYGSGIFNVRSAPLISNCSFSGNSTLEDGGGAGVFNSLSSPVISNCNFFDNTAFNGGGGISNSESNPIISDCNFSNNTANVGGGINNISSSPQLTSCTFSSNVAVHGAGMHNNKSSPILNSCNFSDHTASNGGGIFNIMSTPNISNCTFSDNTASNHGGGMYNTSSSPNLTTCIFSGNAATLGAGMSNESNSSPVITDCDFSENIASSNGGGMYNTSSSPNLTTCIFSDNTATIGAGMSNESNSSPVITDCDFSENIASNNGGGMYIKSSSPALLNCNFIANVANINGGSGGGIYIENFSSPSITGCNIYGNSANYGGGIHNYINSSPTVSNCKISGNTANIGGGFYNLSYSSPIITNCIVSGNSGSGAIVNLVYCSPTFVNSVISGNKTLNSGVVSNNVESSPSFINCIIYGNGTGITNFGGSNPIFSFTNIEGGYVGAGNIDQDPLFVNAPHYNSAPFTGGDYRLQACSPSINKGNNAGYSGNINTDKDLDGNTRLSGAAIDMGAYEYQNIVFPPAITCPSNVSNIHLGANCSASLPDYTLFANAYSFCGVQSVTQFPVPGSSVFSEGAITVTLTVTSNNGLTSQCSFLVFVEDITFPAIICPTNQTVTMGQNCTGVLQDYRSLTQASDNCNIQNVFQGPSAFTTISGAGFVNVTMTAIDVHGNLSQCNFTVTKVDNSPPSITCPSTQTIILNHNCAATLPNYTGLATTGDNCGVQSVTQIPSAGTTVSGAGNITVTLRVTDVNGLQNQCSFIVTKIDNSPPTITCLPTQTIFLDSECSALLPDYTGLATTGDNCGVQNVTQMPAAGTTIPGTGEISVTLTVTDINGLSSSCSFNATTIDNSPPAIECFNQTINFNGETIIPLDPNELVETADNCGGTGIILSSASVNSSQVGQIVPILVTVTDINGNSATCTSQISVGGLPPGWSQNVNGVGCANGNEIDYNPSTEVWTATSINCYYSSPFTSDGTAFAQRTLCGDGSITAQVTGISGTSLGWAGMVMRETNAAGARKAQLSTNMAGNQSRREYRVTTNGSALPQNFAAQNKFWLRIVRSGNQFIMYNSSNGVQWSLVGTQTIVMGSCIQIGLVVTNYTSNSTVIATFANVSYTGNGPILNSTIPEDGNLAVALNIQPEFNVYPNPSSGELNMDLKGFIGKEVQIELYSMEGKLMHLVILDEVLKNIQSLQLDRYAAGIYFVKLKSAGLPDVTKKIVLQK
jgi:parallel beta-helix repeat protein